MALHDAHIHLDFMGNAREVALSARDKGLGMFANTVTPAGFSRTLEMVGDLENVHVGLGQHPWWAAESNLGLFDELFPTTRWIGEVGLDLSPKRPHHQRQREAFHHIARRCGAGGNKILSLHSVRAAGEVLDTLEETGCTQSCRCIFHWFSGSTEDLWRAIRAGCWFSVNEMQAGTRRAKEQLKLVPKERLLLETDLPPAEDATTTVTDVLASLERTRTLLETIRNEQLADQLQANWLRLCM